MLPKSLAQHILQSKMTRYVSKRTFIKKLLVQETPTISTTKESLSNTISI